MSYRIIVGDCIEGLCTIPDRSVHTCVTSPPYYGLRDYGREGQIGLEETPEAYIAKMVEVFREVKRVLRDDGTLWLNIGDSYWAGKGSNGSSKARATAEERGYAQSSGTVKMDTRPTDGKHDVIKAKDLIGIPWMLAFALRADGWYLRQDIIWHKPNPMPESVTDRCTKAHEYVFLLSKSERYYYDTIAVKEPLSEATKKRDQTPRGRSQNGGKSTESMGGYDYSRKDLGNMTSNPLGRNRRSVWTINTKPFKGAHFAVMPEALVEPCVLAGTSEHGCCSNCGAPFVRKVERVTQSDSVAGPKSTQKREQGLVTAFSGYADGSTAPVFKTIGWETKCDCGAEIKPCVVLDPFTGSGTTAVVSLRHGRDFVGCELNADYVKIANERILGDASLFNSKEGGNNE